MAARSHPGDSKYALLPHVFARDIRTVDFPVLGTSPGISEWFPVQSSVAVIHSNGELLADMMALASMRDRLVLALGSAGRDTENRSMSTATAH